MPTRPRSTSSRRAVGKTLVVPCRATAFRSRTVPLASCRSQQEELIPLGGTGAVVGVVTIMCTKTGDFVPTGIELDAEGFKAFPPIVLRIRCPSCGSEHAWSKGRAWLTEGAPLVRGGQLSTEVVNSIQAKGRTSLELHSLAKVIEGKPNPLPASSKPRSMREYLTKALLQF